MAHRLLLLLVMSGCVVPIPAEVENQDGGINSPPVILHPVPEMPFGNTAGPLNRSDFTEVTFDVKDIDVNDPMVVRVFRNYQLGGLNLNKIDERQIPGGEALRPVLLNTGTWCLGSEGVTNVVFEVVVADRGFEPTGLVEPVFRVPNEGGDVAIRSWVMNCL